MSSGILYDADVRFYHPLDNTTEYTKDLGWTIFGNWLDFVPSILTSGVKTTDGVGTSHITYDTGSEYTSLNNIIGCTFAVWVSGFLGGDSNSRQVAIGFANSSSNFRDGIKLDKTTPATGFRVIATFNNTDKLKDWTPPPSNDTDWHFFVIDIRFETSGWRHRASLDGGDWLDLGVNNQVGQFSATSEPMVRIIDAVTSPKIIVDETIVWADNDLFTAQELSNLYELYNTYSTTMDQYEATYGIPINSGTTCFIAGHLEASGDASLFIDGQYGLLHDEFVKYYHPVDDNVEFTKNLAWTPAGVDFVPSLFTSGIQPINVLAKLSLDGYDDLSATSGFTMATWASGFLGNDGSGRGIYAGFSDASANKRNTIRIFKQHPIIRTSINIEGAQSNRDWSPAPPSDDDWHFFVADARYETSGWRHRVSLDGSDWVDLGVDSQTSVPGTDERAYVESLLSTSGAPFVVDEIVLWGSNNLFTSQELSNLYELGNTHNKTMDQYLSIFAPIFSIASLYIKGSVESSGNTNSYTLGHKLVSGIADLYLLSTPLASFSGNLYIAGPIPISDNFDSSITGHLPVSGESTLFIQGRLQDTDAFVSVADNNPSDNFTLFTHGVPSGDSTTFYTNESATLFISDNGDVTDVNSSWPAFTRVADAITASGSGVWSSFVRVGNVVDNNINLYINGHAPGDNVHGPLVSDSFDIFINGLATQDGDEGLLSDGYSVANEETLSFVRIYDGLNDTANLYISGEIPIIPPSASSDLFIFGISGIESGSSTLHIHGNAPTSGTFDLFVLGISGVESGSFTLYLQVTNVGLFNSENTLFSHGF